MQSSPQQQGRARELEQELSRLRQEGEAYRDDLKQQLEGAKQAAMQARHEAGQANAHATHEHSLVQQLQEDKRRMADIVDSWKRQGREQQVWLQCHLESKVLTCHYVRPCAIVALQGFIEVSANTVTLCTMCPLVSAYVCA